MECGEFHSGPPHSKGRHHCLSGGGNFGDLYPHFQQFRERVVEHYPDNRIVILPQSIYYEHEEI
ncbi:hypothetical protein PO124_11350 [Bacillus licheniformis]|nr:hypothetical protein [Bacillus licheniformis]